MERDKMVEVNFYPVGTMKNDQLKYAVIVTEYKGKWVLAKHRNRDTWEIPGGHREQNELIMDTASRELFEETGAVKFDLKHVCEYSVTRGDTNYGGLFYAVVEELGDLPDLEIEKIDLFDELPENLTYPTIQPKLFKRVLEEK